MMTTYTYRTEDGHTGTIESTHARRQGLYWHLIAQVFAKERTRKERERKMLDVRLERGKEQG
jgi:hypothetical protein